LDEGGRERPLTRVVCTDANEKDNPQAPGRGFLAVCKTLAITDELRGQNKLTNHGVSKEKTGGAAGVLNQKKRSVVQQGAGKPIPASLNVSCKRST